jgi:hypothetical protein
MTDENELNELRGLAERLGANDFINVGDIIRNNIDGKWVNPTGAYNVALRERLTTISVADNWAEAKLEWKATGNIWYVPMRETADDVLPSIHQESHPHECICGHKIAWHFEIINTENELREIVGSEHIGFWMVARHLIENLNIPIDMITQERVKQWTDEAVASMKAKWWWKQHGEQFEEWFEAVSETDLRVNIRNGDSYWDEDTSRYEHQPLIRKKSSNAYGTSDYQMASILWRWNHPDNKKWFYYHDKTGKRIKKTTYDDLMWDDKRNYTRGTTTESTAQKNTRGWPNDRLWNDLMIFYFDLDNQKAKLVEQDAERAERVAFVVQEKIEQEERRAREQVEYEAREAIRREKRRLAQEEHQIKLDGAFEKFCEANDLPIFNSEYGSNNWEQTFLSDMIRKINNLNPMSTKQKERVIKIINRVSEPATEKQLSYIRSLGGEPNKDITKRDASREIERLKNPPKSESETGEEE